MAAQLTQAGLDAMAGTGRANFTYLGVGTGSASFSLGMTAMGTELVRVALSVSLSSSALTMTAYLNSAQANGTLTEYGMWDAASGGNLLLYGTWPTAKVKDSSEAMLISETVTLANA
jgi:hypothetical protein